MSRRTALPDPFDRGAFGVADARRAGVPSRLRWLERPFRGVCSHEECDSLRARAAALQLVLPVDSAYCLGTAARLLELPLPPSQTREDLPLEVMTPTGRPAVRHRGTRGHRGLESRRTCLVAGLRVISPVDAWLDLASALALDDLVILGDAILARNPRLIDALREGVRRRAGSRGIRRAREALELIRPGVRSPMETLTRLLLVRGGLPEPELNAEVTDAAHTWLAEVDMVWRDRRVIVEYDGRWHADAGQRRLDATRRRQLRAEGWIVIELFAEDILKYPERTVRLVREALEGRVAS